MNKNWTTVVLIILILIFAGYIVIDITLKKHVTSEAPAVSTSTENNDKWFITRTFDPGKVQLASIFVTGNGRIILGGEPFLVCYDPDFNLIWEVKTEMPVTAIASSGNLIYAAVQNKIMVYGENGEKIDEWGPFEENSIITSVSANDNNIAFADAANKTIFLLDKSGVVKNFIGKTDEPFVIPSGYFDVALAGENIYIANPGKLRVERRNTDGKLLDSFGVPGMDPDAFCGCCNPSHFAVIPGGFVTAEKGINRIKILDSKGNFVEFVSSVNSFIPPLPLDIASSDGKIIYGANPADSKVYVFKRK